VGGARPNLFTHTLPSPIEGEGNKYGDAPLSGGTWLPFGALTAMRSRSGGWPRQRAVLVRAAGQSGLYFTPQSFHSR